ncbi:MAG: killer suppression protein [Phycisphaerae bacterium]|nr:killer suppression protein [Phycisphaerae bacterium]
MDVYFSTRNMQRRCSSNKEMQKEWGDRIAKKLQQRLMELRAAEVLSDVSRVPPPRCHELSGDRKGQLSVDLVHPYRLYFAPDHDPLPRKPDGGLEWARVTRIVVLEVFDPHKR